MALGTKWYVKSRVYFTLKYGIKVHAFLFNSIVLIYNWVYSKAKQLHQINEHAGLFHTWEYGISPILDKITQLNIVQQKLAKTK